MLGAIESGYAAPIEYGAMTKVEDSPVSSFGLLDALKLGLQAAGQGYSAYTQYEGLKQSADAAKAQQRQAERELQLLREQQALAAQSRLESEARILENHGAGGGVPTTTIAIGLAALAVGAYFFMKRRR